MMAKRLLPLFFIWLCFLIALSAQSKKFLKGLILGTLLSQQAMPHYYPMPYYHMTHGHSAW